MRWFALAAVGIVACSDSDLVLSPTEDVRADVEASVARWQAACPQVRLSIGPDGVPVETSEDLGKYAGYTDLDGDADPTRIRVRPGTERAEVLDHEIGHALGLQHGDSPLMTVKRQGGAHVGAEDCAAYLRRR